MVQARQAQTSWSCWPHSGLGLWPGTDTRRQRSTSSPVWDRCLPPGQRGAGARPAGTAPCSRRGEPLASRRLRAARQPWAGARCLLLLHGRLPRPAPPCVPICSSDVPLVQTCFPRSFPEVLQSGYERDEEADRGGGGLSCSLRLCLAVSRILFPDSLQVAGAPPVSSLGTRSGLLLPGREGLALRGAGAGAGGRGLRWHLLSSVTTTISLPRALWWVQMIA